MKMLLAIILVGAIVLVYYGTKSILSQPSKQKRTRGQRRRR